MIKLKQHERLRFKLLLVTVNSLRTQNKLSALGLLRSMRRYECNSRLIEDKKNGASIKLELDKIKFTKFEKLLFKLVLIVENSIRRLFAKDKISALAMLRRSREYQRSGQHCLDQEKHKSFMNDMNNPANPAHHLYHLNHLSPPNSHSHSNHNCGYQDPNKWH